LIENDWERSSVIPREVLKRKSNDKNDTFDELETFKMYLFAYEVSGCVCICACGLRRGCESMTFKIGLMQCRFTHKHGALHIYIEFVLEIFLLG
jgi:hypothetical protein